MARKLDDVIAALPKYRKKRVEDRAMLSTMRHYVECMGGKLELVAKFPDRPSVVINHLGGEVTLNKPVSAARRSRATV